VVFISTLLFANGYTCFTCFFVVVKNNAVQYRLNNKVVSFNSGRYVTLKYFLSYAKWRKSYHRQNHAGRTEQYRHRGVEQTNRLSWLADIDWLSYTTLPDSAFALHQWMKWMKWINQSVNQ